MNTQQLKEQLDGWQDHYSDPADKENHDFFTTLISAIERLEAAERERDELKALAEGQSELAGCNAARAQKAEEEIARRDAAVVEPVSWPDMPFSFEELKGMHGATFANGYVRGWARKCESVTMKGRLYTAAPHALLPPEMKPEPDKYDVIDHGFIAGYNKCRSDALVLGAQQQQKVVELPEPVKWPEIPFKYFSEEQVFSMLDAAGVKWEVKT